MTIKHTPGPWREIDGQVWTNHGKDDFLVVSCRGLKGVNAEANAYLIAVAPTAPHKCDDPECPGNKNRLKLVAFEELLEVSKEVLKFMEEQWAIVFYSFPKLGQYPEIDLLKAAIAKIEEVK